MKLKEIILIISMIILLFLSSCSLLIDGYTRNVGYNSICWEDNDHILIYANIEAYDDYTTIGGGARKYIWVGGEIWRINVNTGEKELLMRKKEWDYAINEKYANAYYNLACCYSKLKKTMMYIHVYKYHVKQLITMLKH